VGENRLALRVIAGAAALLLSACASNSPGRYPDVPLYAGPLLQYKEYVKSNPNNPKVSILQKEALNHLEDVVETAVGEVLGAPFDANSPEVVPYGHLIEASDFVVYLPEDSLQLEWYGVKYLSDHCGSDIDEAVKHHEAKRISAIIKGYLKDKLTLAQAKKELRRSEKKLYEALDISSEEVIENEKKYDAAVRSVPMLTGSIGIPFVYFKPTVVIRASYFRDASINRLAGSLAHEYGHYWMEAQRSYLTRSLELCIGSDYHGEEARIVETSMEVFSHEVCEVLKRKKFLKEGKRIVYATDELKKRLDKLGNLYFHPKKFYATVNILKRYSRHEDHEKEPQSLFNKIKGVVSARGWKWFFDWLNDSPSLLDLETHYIRAK